MSPVSPLVYACAFGFLKFSEADVMGDLASGDSGRAFRGLVRRFV